MKTLLITILLIIPFRAFAPPNLSILEVKIVYQYTFTPERLKTALKCFVKYPDIVFAQAQLETGNFTSAIFLENNNLFGMKQPKIRPTTCKGVNRGHAVYSCWLDSVKDYALWVEYYGSHGHTDFKVLLKKFNSRPAYINRVNYIVKLNSKKS